MLQGYRTYIMVVAMMLYNTAAALGVSGIGTAEEFRVATDLVVNVILGVAAIVFRLKAKPK